MMQNTKIIVAKVIIHLIALAFLFSYYYLAVSDNLGGDPVESIIHFTGIGALNLLLITLLVSPLAKKFKASWLLQLRRLLGLYAFTYALAHLLNFIFFELQFDFSLLISEIIPIDTSEVYPWVPSVAKTWSPTRKFVPNVLEVRGVVSVEVIVTDVLPAVELIPQPVA